MPLAVDLVHVPDGIVVEASLGGVILLMGEEETKTKEEVVRSVGRVGAFFVLKSSLEFICNG